jgi:aryl-alcohol dehydrogenase-like predicted oxidoreductase
MQTRRIGSLEVSVVGLGCNNFGGRLDADATAQVVGTALEAGVTFFDTADIYGGARSEEFLGRALAGHRDEVVVATKFGAPGEGVAGGASAAYVAQAAEASLRRLGTDRIDLYQLHFPDASVPFAETLGALAELVRAGKVREVGCSNMTVDQLRQAEAADAGVRFVSVQNQYSILHRQPEEGVLAECAAAGLSFLPYFPLANGLLTGKVRPGSAPPEGSRLAGLAPDQAERHLSEERLATVGALEEIARHQGHSLLELAVGWLLSRPVVASVIAGATRPEQVRDNAAAAGWIPGEDVLAQVDELAPPPL